MARWYLVPADHDPGRRRVVWPGLGHADRFVCVEPWCHTGLSRITLVVGRLGAGAFRQPAGSVERRHGQGRRVLPFHAAPGAGAAVLHGEPRDGAHTDPSLDLLLGQPAGHARRHPGLRERRDAARTHRVVGRHRVAGPAGRARALGAATDRGPQTDRRAAGAQGLRPGASPEAVRPQPDCDRRRLGRPGDGLHCCRVAREGHLGREASHGRRLPQHRLRAVEGADSFGQVAVPHQARAGVRHPRGRCAVRLCRSDGARAARGQNHRTARLGGALHRTWG